MGRMGRGNGPDARSVDSPASACRRASSCLGMSATYQLSPHRSSASSCGTRKCVSASRRASGVGASATASCGRNGSRRSRSSIILIFVFVSVSRASSCRLGCPPLAQVLLPRDELEEHGVVVRVAFLLKALVIRRIPHVHGRRERNLLRRRDALARGRIEARVPSKHRGGALQLPRAVAELHEAEVLLDGRRSGRARQPRRASRERASREARGAGFPRFVVLPDARSLILRSLRSSAHEISGCSSRATSSVHRSSSSTTADGEVGRGWWRRPPVARLPGAGAHPRRSATEACIFE